VSGQKRRSSRRQAHDADWLGREHPVRVRRWALEEQLLGHPGSEQRQTLEEQLFREQLSLSRMDAALHEQMRRVAELQRRLTESPDETAGPSVTNVGSAPTAYVRAPDGSTDRDYWLSRCHGFHVETPTGEMGTVCGVRFGSRLDRPDLIEIVVGRLRKRLFVVPVEEIEEIWFDEQQLALSRDPRRHTYRDHFHQLVVRLRGKPRMSHS
jgi:hypothetical protein